MRWGSFAMRTLFCAVLLFAPLALAQEPVRYAKQTTLNFEDDAIDGALVKPDGEHLQARQKVKHSNLIRVRQEFRRKSFETLGVMR